MDKQRVMPVLAGAVLAVSLTACQGMMGGRESAQTSSAPAGSTAAGNQQALSSDLVRDVQRGLASRGYDVGPQDGIFGDSTEQSLRRFQRDQRMNASGQIDAQTLAALGVIGGASQRASAGAPGSRDYVPTSRRQGAMATPSSATRVGLSRDQVRNVQQTLADRGYDPGRPDGRWGARTQQALRNFQRDQNMQANGRPDQQTLAALGLEAGAPGTQTGQLPAENREAVPERRDLGTPEQQQGALPPGPPPAPDIERVPEPIPATPNVQPAEPQ
ncbi:MAG TPA: peptidoglycan-binding domain-containing protein [Magnetospirillum sp.]|nr:peptidoglycan-binding domain-containing protein [Magnetospirillum sp.]